jgi:6-pyruvoyltetrahydropterin/6-carboxytetrahydropterin synthase
VTQQTVGDVKPATGSIVTSVGAVPQVTYVTTTSSNPFPQPVGQSNLQVRVRIGKEFRISSAHFLPHHNGKCKNLHGHNYRIRLTMVGDVDPLTGMVKDFYDLNADFEAIIGISDHRSLNDLMDNPTAENLSVRWLERLRVKDGRYSSVIVWETDDCFAEASCDPYPYSEQGRRLEHFSR